MSKIISLKMRRRLVRLFLQSPSGYRWFCSSLTQWNSKANNTWRAEPKDLFPIISDRHDTSGLGAKGHYFLQDLWAAQNIALIKPNKHLDVGSSVVGFNAHVASFCAVEFVDIRPLSCRVPNLEWKEGSINRLPYDSNSVRSLSCLHVIEHVGLGRYGDPIDPDAWLEGLQELSRVLAPAGQLLIGTPVGRRTVRFNAHRIFDPQDIPQALDNLKLEEFALIENDEALSWRNNASFADARSCEYGCGLYRFTKTLA
jgi:SAM-dependent methyltransferase